MEREVKPYQEVITIGRCSNGYVVADITEPETPTVKVYTDVTSLLEAIRPRLERLEKPVSTTEKMTDEELAKVGWPSNVLKLDRPKGPFPTDEHPA